MRWMGPMLLAGALGASSCGAPARTKPEATTHGESAANAMRAPAAEPAPAEPATVPSLPTAETQPDEPAAAPGETQPSTHPGESGNPGDPAEPTPEPAQEGPKFRGVPIDQLLRDMANKPVVKVIKKFERAEPFWWLDLGDGLQIAFKPGTKARSEIWRNDAMAWEFSRLLGISDRVPPVTGRLLPRSLLGNPKDVKPAVEDKSMVWGSVIYWMPVLERSHLAGEAGTKRWSRWLALGTKVPPEWQIHAEDMSALLVFDYLQSNQDRIDHPSNLQVDEFGHVVFRDNNEAWNSGAMHALSVNRANLELCQKFSRSLIDGVRKADVAAIEAAIQPWAERGRPLLGRQQIDNYGKRRAVVLKYVDRLVKKHGEDKILVFP